MGSVEVTSIDPVKLVGPLDHAGRGKYRRQFLCADRFRSQPMLLQSAGPALAGAVHVTLRLDSDAADTVGADGAEGASPPTSVTVTVIACVAVFSRVPVPLVACTVTW